jgi:plastocyanin
MNASTRLFFVLLVFVLSAESLSAQTAEVSGTVSIPSIKKEERTFRGQAYRNRLSPTPESASESKSGSSSLEDIIVSVHPISFKADVQPLAEPARIIQRNATFQPYVTPITQGSIVQFINEDAFYHNVFSLTPGAKFNIGRRPTGDVVSKKIEPISQRISALGEVKLFCDIHTQMKAIILSLDTPYFTRVKASGQYQIKNLPVGTYQIKVYHPDAQPVVETIELKAGEPLRKNFALSN